MHKSEDEFYVQTGLRAVLLTLLSIAGFKHKKEAICLNASE